VITNRRGEDPSSRRRQVAELGELVVAYGFEKTTVSADPVDPVPDMKLEAA
jgi:hypothetical protein